MPIDDKICEGLKNLYFKEENQLKNTEFGNIIIKVLGKQHALKNRTNFEDFEGDEIF